MLYILSSIGHTVRIEIRECVKWSLRDCSLFMPKGGSVIFKQFRHMKNLPLPGSGYFKKLPPPVYVTGPKCNPPPPSPLPSRHDVPPIAIQELKNNGKSINFQAQKEVAVAVAYGRWSVTRGSNCKALTGKVLVFWTGGLL